MEDSFAKNIRVIVVSSKYPPEYAGSGLRAHRTYLRLKEKFGVEFETLCSSLLYFKWRTEQYDTDGVSVTLISSPFKRFMLKSEKTGKLWTKRFWYILSGIDECLRTIWFLFKKGNRFDVVHIFGSSWSGGIAKIWAGLNKKKLLVEIVNHSGSPDDPAGLRPFVKMAVRNKGLVIAISPLLERKVLDSGYKNVWCRPNPVDEKKFFVDRPKRMQWRSKYTHFSESDILLLEMSKYIPRKNKELALRSLSYLPEQYKLIIAGPLEKVDQEQYFNLKKLASELGLEHRAIIMYGFIENPEHYYQMSDVFLFPSLADALGTPVLEAICCGIPVVANRINGVTDWWIRDGINGYICDSTPESFAECIKKAVKISTHILDASANDLIRQVSTEVIDAEYYEYLTKRNTQDKNLNNIETYNPVFYETPQRLASFYYQVKSSQPELNNAEVVINIGKGSGYLGWYIGGRTNFSGLFYNVDIERSVAPDILSSVTSLGITSKVADIVFCCQVLEHLSYDKFSASLSELYRITKPRGKVVLSLPNGDFHITISLKLPKLRIKKFIKIPFLRVRHSPLDKKHFWEIDRKGYSLQRVIREIEKHFIVESIFRSFENPYHHFFVLRPKEEISTHGR